MRKIISIFCCFISLANAQFYVSPTGSDSNPGTRVSPFLTLAKCQLAMQSGTKTCYFRAGIYSVTQGSITNGATPCGGYSCGCNLGIAAVYLVAADNGETWSYDPMDGYNTAILDAQAPVVTQTGNSSTPFSAPPFLACAFASQIANNVTITGLVFQHWNLSALAAVGGAYNFTNNIMSDFRLVHDGGTPVALGCGTSGSTVSNNFFQNIPYHGVSITCNTSPMSNLLTSTNFFLNICTWQANTLAASGGDCGAIYEQLENTGNSNIQNINNYIRDVNASSNGAGSFNNGCCAFGLYLDGDYGVSSISNVIEGKKSACYSQDGGNNRFIRNICDVGNPGYQIIAQDVNPSPFAALGNVFQSNIVVANGNITSTLGSTTGDGYVSSNACGTPCLNNPMLISKNAYWNYHGTSVRNVGDSQPVYEDPKLSGWSVGQFLSSGVFNAPVSFTCLPGGWGPPGFTVPTSGTPPSWPLTNIGTGCINGTSKGIAVIY